ncbi:hypothetical protein B0H11DRAFT_2259336 [Mycena galericulata]|nr:hypothetical protein B0H11DRAFT_2259336 [Mycena galericulata]
MNTGSTPIEIFTSEFTVPPAPATYDSQTIFIFPSIEPSTFDAIMQPVLQYGGSAAGGGEYWAVATWYLYSDDTFYTTPIEVSPGQSLGGVIWFLEESGGAYNYIAGFAGMGDTELEVDGGEQLTWATNTLESYGVTQASDYPAGSTVFTEVSILLTNGQYAPVSWSTSSDPADGLYTTVNVNGGDNAVITITY